MKKIASIITLFIAFAVAAQVPETMHFQGFLSDPGTGDAVADGNYSITFTIFDASTAGTSLWTETHGTVSVADGYFSVILGAEGTPLTIAFDIPYYLEVEVGGETLSPRYTLSTSAYAFTAKSVEGLTLSNGKLGLGTTTPIAELDIVGTDVSGGIQGRVQNLDPTGWSSYTLRNDLGNAYSISIGGSTATNAPGKLYIFNGYTSSSSMVVAENGYIGIGTENPQQLLNLSADGKATIKVDSYSDTQSSGISFLRSRGSLGSESSVQVGDILGRIEFRGFENTLDDFITSAKIQARAAETWGSTSYGSELVFSTIENGTNVMGERMIIDHNGNVGIGTEDPASLLTVSGGTVGIYSYGSVNSFNINRANGTESSPEVVSDGDILGNYSFRGWDGTSYLSGAFIRAEATETWSSTGKGTKLRFHTNPNGSTSSFVRMTIADDGDVGIGRESTANSLEVEGAASKTAAGDWLANSDIRIKMDVKDITNSLELVKELRPVKFKYTEEWKSEHPSIEDHFYYNFIAQEYQKVFPDAVRGSGEYLNGSSEEILQIDTYNAQIVSIKAVQELIYKVEALEKENASLQTANKNLQSELGELKSSLDRIEKALSLGDKKVVETIDSED